MAVQRFGDNTPTYRIFFARLTRILDFLDAVYCVNVGELWRHIGENIMGIELSQAVYLDRCQALEGLGRLYCETAARPEQWHTTMVAIWGPVLGASR